MGTNLAESRIWIVRLWRGPPQILNVVVFSNGTYVQVELLLDLLHISASGSVAIDEFLREHVGSAFVP